MKQEHLSEKVGPTRKKENIGKCAANQSIRWIDKASPHADIMTKDRPKYTNRDKKNREMQKETTLKKNM